MPCKLEFGACPHLVPEAVIVACYDAESVLPGRNVRVERYTPRTGILPRFVVPFELVFEQNSLRHEVAESRIVKLQLVRAGGEDKRAPRRNDFLIHNNLFDPHRGEEFVPAQGVRVDHYRPLPRRKPDSPVACPYSACRPVAETFVCLYAVGADVDAGFHGRHPPICKAIEIFAADSPDPSGAAHPEIPGAIAEHAEDCIIEQSGPGVIHRESAFPVPRQAAPGRAEPDAPALVIIDGADPVAGHSVGRREASQDAILYPHKGVRSPDPHDVLALRIETAHVEEGRIRLSRRSIWDEPSPLEPEKARMIDERDNTAVVLAQRRKPPVRQPRRSVILRHAAPVDMDELTCLRDPEASVTGDQGRPNRDVEFCVCPVFQASDIRTLVAQEVETAVACFNDARDTIIGKSLVRGIRRDADVSELIQPASRAYPKTPLPVFDDGGNAVVRQPVRFRE